MDVDDAPLAERPVAVEGEGREAVHDEKVEELLYWSLFGRETTGATGATLDPSDIRATERAGWEVVLRDCNGEDMLSTDADTATAAAAVVTAAEFDIGDCG